jgi:negative regulator of genetic competence, sporulation and motility
VRGENLPGVADTVIILGAGWFFATGTITLGSETFDIWINGNMSDGDEAVIAIQEGLSVIFDNYQQPTLSINDVTVNEDVGAATFTVTLSNTSSSPVTVDYSAANGTATAGSDYEAISGTLTFSPGETAKTISIPIIDDFIYEGNEAFYLNLSNPANATIIDDQGMGIIVDYNDEPTLSINDVTVNEDVGIATFTVMLSNPSSFPVTVDYSTVDGTATAGEDYTAILGTLTFNPGETAKTISIPIIDDLIYEGNEAFYLNLSNPTNATIIDDQGIGIIVDYNDEPTLSINDVTVNEDDGAATFTVMLSNPSSFPVTVDYSTADGTATGGSDYTAISGTLTFNPGEIAQIISVPINDDHIYEGDETFYLNLSNPINATIIDDQGIGIILNDDLPTLSINDVTVNEDDGAAIFTVTLSNPSSFPATVDYSTADGTATAGEDYTANSGTLTFNPSETAKTISISIIDDLIYEGDEAFYLNLSNPTNATIIDDQGIGTILNNDQQPALSINDVTVNEDDGAATFTMSLSNPSSFPVTVDYSTADGTATAGEDYTASSGTLTFNPSETAKTIPVPIINDLIYEGDETFSLNLSNPANATIVDGQGIGTILNDDLPPELMVGALIDVVDATDDLPKATENSLIASLDNATKVLKDSNPKNDVSAINALQAFINKIEAQRGKKIPEEVADELIAKAQEIIITLNGEK